MKKYYEFTPHRVAIHADHENMFVELVFPTVTIVTTKQLAQLQPLQETTITMLSNLNILDPSPVSNNNLSSLYTLLGMVVLAGKELPQRTNAQIRKKRKFESFLIYFLCFLRFY